MRVLGGVWAGRDLVSPGGRVRPTAEAVRDRWIGLLTADLAGARLLELYAGTGAVALEALSRGAAAADLVENNPAALHSLKANIAALRASRRTRIFKQDALRFAERLPPAAYDIALADPPYGSRQAERIVRRWIEVPFAGILSLEHAADHALPAGGSTHRMGESAVTVYRVRGKSRSVGPMRR